jgi:hypothetical protein
VKLGLRWSILVILTVAMVHSVVVLRSAQHLRRARVAAAGHRPIEAAREYQAAIGCHAPGNPFERAAIGELVALVDATRARDPELARDLEDRLIRSIRGTRWLRQPHRETLAARR